MMLILAENDDAAKEFYDKYRTNLSDDIIIIRSVRTLEGLRFRYEDIIYVPGWSKRDDVEAIQDQIRRTHAVCKTMNPTRTTDKGVDWDIDANLPTYTRDFLRMIKEGTFEYDICTYGTETH